MADARVISVRLVADTTGYSNGIRKAAQDTTRFGRQAESVGKSVNATGTFTGSASKQFQRFGKEAAAAGQQVGLMAKGASLLGSTLGTAAGTMIGFVAASAVVSTLTRAFSLLVGETVKFDTAMRNVQSITKDSDAELSRMGDKVMELSTSLPQSLPELADGLYQVASSGFAGADGLTVLTASATAASAGLSNTETAVRAITAVLNAYGLSAVQAADVSDIMFQTVNLGILSFEELAGQVGDFVGTAAALGVPFDQAAAGIAAITRSGINAAESATALNRVFLELIKPSEELTGVLQEWGYESGVAAVQSLGFQGVLEKLRSSTGGSIEAMAAFFPEVRGLKGALALTANEGKTLDITMKGIATAAGRAEAAQKALAEQSKSLSYQMSVVGNRVQVAFSKIGREAIPYIIAGMGVMRDAVREVADVGATVGKVMGPTFSNIGNALGDLAKMARVAAEAIGPLVKAFAVATLVPFAVALNGITAALASVTRFMAEHEAIVIALSAAYVSSLVPGVLSAMSAFAALQKLRVAIWLLPITTALRPLIAGLGATAALLSQGQLVGGMQAAGAAAQTFGRSLLGLVNPATVAAAALAAIALTINTLRNEGAKAQANVDKIVQPFDLNTISSYEDAIRAVGGLANEAARATEEYRGFGGGLKALGEVANPFAENKGFASLEEAERGAARAAELTAEMRVLAGAASQVAKNIGLIGERPVVPVRTNADVAKASAAIKLYERSVDAGIDKVLTFANSVGIKLPKSSQASESWTKQVTKAMKETAKAAGFSGDAVGQMSEDQIAGLADAAKAMGEYQKKVSETFTTATSVVSKFSGETNVSQSEILGFMKSAKSETAEFITLFRKAGEKGIAPSILTQIATEGPKAMGLLKGLVNGTNEEFVRSVNASQAEIQRMINFTAEMARLARFAELDPTDTLTRQLATAMDVARVTMEQGAFATVESVAAALHLTPSEAASIADSFGITLPNLEAWVKINDVPIALADVAAIKQGIMEIPPEKRTVVSIKDPDQAKAWWDDLRGRLEKIPGLRETVAAIDDPQVAQVWWAELNAKLGTYDGATATANAEVNDQATWRLDGILLKITSLDGKTATVTINETTRRILRNEIAGPPSINPATGKPWGVDEADGGVLTFRRFADGGMVATRQASFARGGLREKHVAQIAPAGAWRTWAEPETGGEAYIPLAPTKRNRSVGILSEVARRFGMKVEPRGSMKMAAGGVVEQQAAAPADPGAQAPHDPWLARPDDLKQARGAVLSFADGGVVNVIARLATSALRLFGNVNPSFPPDDNLTPDAARKLTAEGRSAQSQVLVRTSMFAQEAAEQAASAEPVTTAAGGMAKGAPLTLAEPGVAEPATQQLAIQQAITGSAGSWAEAATTGLARAEALAKEATAVAAAGPYDPARLRGAFAWAQGELGKPYTLNGRFGPDGYDCSGFVTMFGRQLGGSNIGTVSGSMAAYFRANDDKRLSVEQAKQTPGSVLVYGGLATGPAGHVVVAGPGGMSYESSGSRGVSRQSLSRLPWSDAGLFDSGGVIMPGSTLVVNKTGRPESVIPDGGAAGRTLNMASGGILGPLRQRLRGSGGSLVQSAQEAASGAQGTVERVIRVRAIDEASPVLSRITASVERLPTQRNVALAPQMPREGFTTGHPGNGVTARPESMNQTVVRIESTTNVEGNIYGEKHLRRVIEDSQSAHDESVARKYRQLSGQRR